MLEMVFRLEVFIWEICLLFNLGWEVIKLEFRLLWFLILVFMKKNNLFFMIGLFRLKFVCNWFNFGMKMLLLVILELVKFWLCVNLKIVFLNLLVLFFVIVLIVVFVKLVCVILKGVMLIWIWLMVFNEIGCVLVCLLGVVVFRLNGLLKIELFRLKLLNWLLWFVKLLLLEEGVRCV